MQKCPWSLLTGVAVMLSIKPTKSNRKQPGNLKAPPTELVNSRVLGALARPGVLAAFRVGPWKVTNQGGLAFHFPMGQGLTLACTAHGPSLLYFEK